MNVSEQKNRSCAGRGRLTFFCPKCKISGLFFLKLTKIRKELNLRMGPTVVVGVWNINTNRGPIVPWISLALCAGPLTSQAYSAIITLIQFILLNIINYILFPTHVT